VKAMDVLRTKTEAIGTKATSTFVEVKFPLRLGTARIGGSLVEQGTGKGSFRAFAFAPHRMWMSESTFPTLDEALDRAGKVAVGLLPEILFSLIIPTETARNTWVRVVMM